MTHVDPDSAQWRAMWHALARVTGDCADTCPETGEKWEYVGTFPDRTFHVPTFVHQFRHRHRPASAKPLGDHSCRGRFFIDIHATKLDLVRIVCYPASLQGLRGESAAQARDRLRREASGRGESCGICFGG